MTSQKSFKVQSVIAFSILPAMGVSVIGFSCYNLHLWYLTGNLWSASKYSAGILTNFSETPVIFVVTFGMCLLFVGVGILLIVLGILAPGQYRKEQQARRAANEKPLPKPPSRTKGPG